MRPWLLRPPFLGSGLTSDFSGVVRVTSTKSATDEPRRPGVIGLYLRIAMSLSPVSAPGCLGARSGDRTPEDVDAVAVGEADDRALGVGPTAGSEARAPGLAWTVDGVDARHLHVEHLLDRDLDLGLVGAGAHQEGVLVRVEEAVALLAHDRRDQHVAVVLVEVAHFDSSSPDSSVSCSVAAAVVSGSVASGSVASGSVASGSAGWTGSELASRPPTNASYAPLVNT